MGRKPNPLILEFFERGPKLADQSNRYQHTCKRCGEVFPKGRPDSLQRHIFEKCPNVSESDRTRALWQQTPDAFQQFEVDVPYLPQREPSGLDALAEVSRQMQENGEVGDESLAAQLRLHMEDDGPHSGDDAHAAASEHDSETPPGYTPADMRNSPLVNTASAANELAEAALHHPHSPAEPVIVNPRKRKAPAAPVLPVPAVVDAFQYHPQRPPPAVDPQLQPFEDASTVIVATPAHPSVDALSQSARSAQLAQESTVNNTGFGLLQRTGRSKARGRFSEERRKEVQTVRKKGACIRCRMLKKPCSEGTPCGTCKNIESARLWKNQCIRTRIADEFTLYQASLFYAKDRANVFAALGAKEPCPVPGRIEVTLYPDTRIYATFAVLQINGPEDRQGTSNQDTQPDANINPDLSNNQSDKDQSSPTTLLLSYRAEDTLAAKLERYIHAAIMQCISREPSEFMRSTLEFATELGVEANDTLMNKLINLWAATNLLITKEPLWAISYDPQQKPSLDAVTIEDQQRDKGQDNTASDQETPQVRRWFDTNSRDYELIHAQLQDATERYCQKQAKWVMNELERRLLQRQQQSSFLTFLAAVILLNCVERMTGLFRSFDPSTTSSPTNSVDHTNEAELSAPPANDNPTNPPNWPLDDHPSTFWHQGHSFASLLHLLLRMRGLPPTTTVRADGSLAIINNFNKSHPGVITSTTEGGDSQLQLAALWIERTGIDALALIQRKDIPDDDPGDGDARSWDLRFIAPLLLPS